MASDPIPSTGDAGTVADASASRRFVAFISYSHRDSVAARWLHASLEKFVIPPALRTNAGGRKRLAPVFRDEADLASSANLSDALTQALTDAKALIVIASPASAKSEWVQQEIIAFKQMGRANQVFCLIVDGEPYASERGDPAQECLPLAMRRVVDATGVTEARAEPLAVDLRKDGKRDALLRIAAGLLGVGFDALKRREQRRRQFQLMVVVAASLVGMAVTSTLALRAYWAEQEARHQQQVAEREAKIARETTGFVVSLFQTADPFKTRGESITAREVLDAGLVRIHTAFSEAPEIRASLLSSMGEVYQGLGLYKTSSALFGELQNPVLMDALDPPSRLRFLDSYAQTNYNIGDYAKANVLMHQAEPLLDLPQTAADAVERGRARNILAELAIQGGDAKLADSWLTKNLQDLPKSAQDTRLQQALSYFNRGSLRLAQHDYAGARQALQSALTLRTQSLGPDHPWVAEVESSLATADYNAGNYLEAEQKWQAVLPKVKKYFGDQHPEYSSLLQNYALVILERGDFAQAQALFQQSLAIDEKDKAADHDDLAYSLNSLGLAEMGLQHFDKARAYLDRGIAIAREHKHRMRAPLLMNRADLACRQHDAAAAMPLLAEARTALAQDYKNDAWRLAQLNNVALYCQALQPGAAFDGQALVDSLGEIKKRWGADRLYTREARWRIAQAFGARGKPVPAV